MAAADGADSVPAAFEDGDELLTLSEVAGELRVHQLRVHPSTVRLWVSTGQIRGVRSGRRKWLVSRSEIARMMRSASSTLDRVSPTPPDPYSPPTLRPGERGHRAATGAMTTDQAAATARLDSADSAWQRALRASAFAPPDPGLADRIRAIADASADEAAAFSQAAEAGLSWAPIGSAQDMTVSYELRRNGNRRGSPDAWSLFDSAVFGLGTALESTELAAVADAFSRLAAAAHALADEVDSIDQLLGRRPSPP